MADPSRARADDDPGDDLDAQWADLTRRLGDLELPPVDLNDEDDEALPSARSGTSGAYLERTLGPRDYSPDADDADLVDGFEPPDPDPMRDARPAVVLGWVLAFTGLGTLFFIVALWRTAPGFIILGAAACIVGGAGLLLWQLPSHREGDSENGAVV